MTEQEAEELARKLERVWKLELPLEISSWLTHLANAKGFQFRGQVTPTVNLLVKFSSYADSPWISLEWRTCELDCCAGIIEDNCSPEEREVFMPQFRADWLPLFRRNCWLSGCPIDATAHEKAEWIQGFTHEELESWNLKM